MSTINQSNSKLLPKIDFRNYRAKRKRVSRGNGEELDSAQKITQHYTKRKAAMAGPGK